MKTQRQYNQGSAPYASSQRDLPLRLLVAFVIIVISFCVLLGRFYFLQVVKHNDYALRATSNRISLIPTPPTRGEITDINGVVLARNYPAYSLELIPSELSESVDETIAKLSKYVDVTEGDLKRFKKFRAESRSYENIPLKLKLSIEEASRLSAQLYQFKGVEINARTFREYPYGPTLAHIIGYIGRISQKDQAALTEKGTDTLYRGTTHIGKLGLENYYEEQLHGTPGMQEVEKDSLGNIVRVLSTLDPQAGQTLKLSLDMRVQLKADELLGDRRGSIVAINPKTGGIIALVSKPAFDPNLFIDGIDSKTWNDLNTDWQRPMVNRAIQGVYPPGSIFKPFIGMAMLESGKLTQSTMVPAPSSWNIPGSSHRFRSPSRNGHGTVNLSRAITVSSDTFFYRIGYEMGIDKVSPILAQFGLGSATGIDLSHENDGILPSKEWKEKRFAKSKPAVREWHPADMVAVSIGQGYNAYTPIQMAQATSILANNGIVFKPHLVQQIINHETQQVTLIEPTPARTLPFNPSNFDYIKNAMVNVLKSGTGARVGYGLQYNMGGKTGTAQVVQIKQGSRYSASSLAEQHRDHAWFISFAPAENPQIAIAVLIENGGWGANAAPLARQLSDYYLLQLKNEPPLKGKNNTQEAKALMGLTPEQETAAGAKNASR